MQASAISNPHRQKHAGGKDARNGHFARPARPPPQGRQMNQSYVAKKRNGKR